MLCLRPCSNPKGVTKMVSVSAFPWPDEEVLMRIQSIKKLFFRRFVLQAKPAKRNFIL